jgi:hypothetical protein
MARKYLLLWRERREIRSLILAVLCAISTLQNFDGDVSLLMRSYDLLLALLVRAMRTRLPPVLPNSQIRCSVSRFSEVECVTFFRFRKCDLTRLIHALEMPFSISIGFFGHRNYFSGEEALLLLLRRFAYPCRLAELVSFFGLQIPQLSMLLQWTVNFVHSRFSGHLQDLMIWQHLVQPMMAALISKGVSPHMRCWGFLDGTLRPIARPQQGQQAMYSGHKRTHGLKFEMVCLPNGMIAWLSGPYDGRRHDSYMLLCSGLLTRLQQFSDAVGGACVFGDAAYPLSSVLQVGFRGVNLTQEQSAYNLVMSSVRESVEWSFGKIVQYYSFLDFRKNLKVMLSPVGKYFIVGAFLTNCHTCVYGSVTSSFFECFPPTLEHQFKDKYNKLT